MNATKQRSGRPRFTGINTYTDPQGRFEFRYPWDWEESALDDDREGFIVRPESDEPASYFAVWVAPLEVSVLAADLPDLRAGVDDGLRRLTDADIEDSHDTTYNDIVKLERTVTFTEDGARRKRRIWAMYADYWQFIVAFQGSTVEEYAYWLPMGNYCFTSFQLPMALWFATDPAVSKRPGTDPVGPGVTGDGLPGSGTAEATTG